MLTSKCSNIVQKYKFMITIIKIILLNKILNIFIKNNFYNNFNILKFIDIINIFYFS